MTDLDIDRLALVDVSPVGLPAPTLIGELISCPDFAGHRDVDSVHLVVAVVSVRPLFEAGVVWIGPTVGGVCVFKSGLRQFC